MTRSRTKLIYRMTTPLEGDVLIRPHALVVGHGHLRGLEINEVKRIRKRR